MTRFDDQRLRHRLFRRRALASVMVAFVSGVFALLAGTGRTLPLAAQTTTTTPTLPSMIVSITQEVPNGASLATLPLGPVNHTVVNVTNPGLSTLYNQQIVVRTGVQPDAILGVRDLGGMVGVLDILTGGWFHTIASLSPSGTASFVMTWNKVCPGRFPIAVRVGDITASQLFQWTGSPPTGSACPPDETASPQPASYYLLPWPPSAALNTTIPVATSTSTSPASTTTQPTSTTLLVASSTTRPNATGSSTSSTTTTAASTTTTTSVAPTTRTTVAQTRAPTTIVLICKTVGKKRSCAPRVVRPKPPPPRRNSTTTAPTTKKSSK